MRAKVADVQQRTRGTELAGDVPAGTTDLPVEDVDALDWPSGTVTVGFEIYDYTIPGAEDEAFEDEDDADDDADPDAGTITLGTPTSQDYADGVRVQQYPLVYETTAWVQLDAENDDVPVKLDDGLKDRVPTETRDDPEDQETLEVVPGARGEWSARDLVGEQERGLTRGYAAAAGPFSITSTSPSTPHELAACSVEIPSDQHRIIVNYYATMTTPPGKSMSIQFDDAGVDFPLGETTLAISSNGGGTPLIEDVLPLSPLVTEGSVFVRDGQLFATASFPATPMGYMPYSFELPTPGLHRFRLSAFMDPAGGTGTIDDVRLWVVVI